MIKINGENLNTDRKPLVEYLMENNYNQQRIAVEVNGNIVPKSKYDEVILSSGDIVEIVSFVGGG